MIRIFFDLLFTVSSILLLYYVWKDFVIEALRSIAELVTYGDQHDPSFFEWVFSCAHVPWYSSFSVGDLYILACGRFFMEKQVVGDFVRILKLSRTISIPLQLLQTVSIMIQNLQSEHAICKLIVKWSFLFLQLYYFLNYM